MRGVGGGGSGGLGRPLLDPPGQTGHQLSALQLSSWAHPQAGRPLAGGGLPSPLDAWPPDRRCMPRCSRW